MDLGVDLAQGYHLARPAVEQSVWKRWAKRDWAASTTGVRTLEGASSTHRAAS